jgi:protein SCO1/2
LADLRGKSVVVIFGFTHCPDVCPTTMATLAEVKGRLGVDVDRLQVVQKVPGTTSTSYTMDHSTGRGAFDTQGRLSLFLKHEQSVDSIVADLRQLLR